MERPKGWRDTFSRPHLVRENEQAANTITVIQNTIMQAQTQTLELQRQLHGMRTDGVSDLAGQSEIIRRITRNNANTDDMARQIGKLQVLMEFNRECIMYYDWLRGVGSGDSR